MAERYPLARGNPVKFDAVDIGDLAPIANGPLLEPGRLLNMQHVFADEIETTSTSAIEAVALQIGYNPTKSSSALLETIDATAVSQGSHSGTIQTIAAAISKSSATTTALASAFALWPAYALTAGTVTSLNGLYIYGTRSSSGGTIAGMTGVNIAANALATTADKTGLFIGAASGISANIFGIDIDADETVSATAALSIGLRIKQPVNGTGAGNQGLYIIRNGTTAPTMSLDGGTSGYITLTTPATPTSYSLVLPPDVGADGEQLQVDVTGTVGTLTWEAAASTREVKDLEGYMEPSEALRRIQSAPIHRFHYKRDKRGVGKDYETEFVGIVADEAPWAMKHNGRIFNPINAFGHAAAAIQALAAKVEALEAKVA